MMGGIAIVGAVALPVAAVAAFPSAAIAQDYTTGAIAGFVADQSGNPIPGATVTVRSTEQGFSRDYVTNADGSFRASLIPLGNYQITIAAAGYETSVDPSVSVRLGGQSGYRFTLGQTNGASDATSLDEVVVVGTRPALDFSQTTTGLTVDVDQLVERVPIGRSITSVALLAPRVIEGDSNIPGASTSPSLGGSSVAENAFYLNGLNITNFNTYVGGAPVPFDFYRSVDIKTGGYPAEFGRATGGILNAVTKSGTNEFVFELHGNWSPDSLREDMNNTFTRAGVATARNDLTEVDSWSVIAEAGGPLWRDHLYAYGLYQWAETESTTFNSTASTRTHQVNDIPFWGGKIDAYLTDSQRLEFTYFNTEGSYSPDTLVVASNTVGGSTVNLGGENYVARYTGNFTDWLTVSAAYGVNKDQNFTTPLDPNAIYAVDAREIGGAAAFRIPGSNTSTSTNLLTTEREFYRGDVDITFSMYGDHHVRAGFDNEKTTLAHGTIRTGGANYYYYAGDGNTTPIGTDFLDVFTGTLGGGGAPIEGTNSAFYIQDSWDITPALNLQIGLRHDTFSLDNLAGEEVIELKDNWGPRIAFSLDPFGGGQDKFYGSYGRYFIPIASNLSYRGADLLYDTFFRPTTGNTYTYNADGTPVGGLGTPIINADFDICPVGAPGGAAGLRACGVQGDGSAEPADAKYAEGTKATNEDEFILGYEHKFDNQWSIGAALTYRTLNNVSEDVAVDYLVRQYCAANLPGTPTTGQQGACFNQFSGDHQYVILNPGEDLTFLVRETLPNGQRPTLTYRAVDTQLTKPTREYKALEVKVDRAYDGVWSFSGSYVASESVGNYEGTVLSDNGQADAGSTILYDHIGLLEGKYGLLPNHRGHQFKAFGSYTFWDSLTIGANYRLISPRHFGCLSRARNDALSYDYGAAAGVCRPDVLAQRDNGLPFVAQPGITGTNYGDYVVTTNRGTVFKGDWESTLDLSVRYTLPTFGGWMPKGVTLRADVFNVFDEQNAIDYVEAGTLAGNNINANPNYGTVSQYQSARQIRVGFDVRF